MKKLMSFVFAGLAMLLLAAGCNKYDDSELRGKISSLESRVAELESLKTTVSGIQTSVSNLQKNLFVTSVKQEAGSVTLLFSDGSSAVISNGKDGATPQIGIKLDGGVYYWTINGEVVKDAAGKPIPVADENAPQFRVNAGGDLEYSVDGTTWKPVAAAGIDIQVSQTETTVTVTFADGSSITLPKEVPFYLAIESNSALVLSAGESVELPYTVYGAFADDEVEVDLVSVATGLEAAVTPKTGTSGTVTVKCNTTVAGSYKVVVYATNHTGKSDIVSLTFTVGEGGGDETQAYAKFMGGWKNGGETLVFEQYVNDKEEAIENAYLFTYSGFMGGETSIPAVYSTTADAVCFLTSTLAVDGNWTYFFAALDSDEYIETGGPDGDQVLAYGTLSADGSLRITGNEYDAVYSGTTYHEKIVALSIYAYLSKDEGDYKKGYYSLNNVTPMALPVQFDKAAASSVVAAAQKAMSSKDLVLTPVEKVR